MRLHTNIFKILLVKALILLSNGLHSQEDSSMTGNKNFIFWTPTSIKGTPLFGPDNWWIHLGYQRIVNDYGFLCEFGTIVHSNQRDDILSISQLSSKGVHLSMETLRFVKGPFYVGLQMNAQYMETNRRERFFIPTSNTNETIAYKVIRQELDILPKLGFSFLNKRGLSYDIGFSLGPSYVTSKSPEKPKEARYISTDFKEAFSRKPFDEGSKFFPRFALQWRVGYSF